MPAVHTPICPAILYFGTPVVLITTLNPYDPSHAKPYTSTALTNVAPMSSAFWLGDRCILGLASSSQTTRNLLRTGRCTLNLPAFTRRMVRAVNALAKTTGRNDVPGDKLQMGYRFVTDKFAVAGLTSVEDGMSNASSDESEDKRKDDDGTQTPPRIKECAIHMEATLVTSHPMFSDHSVMNGFALVVEVKIEKVWIDERIRLQGYENRVDPDKWRPMIMSFQHLYGLDVSMTLDGTEGEEVGVACGVKDKKLESKLAEIDEELYRMPSS